MLSPTLFSFLINELALEIAQNGMYGVQLTPDVVQILVMLFADDALFASYCVAGLQRQIDILKRSEKEVSSRPMRFGGMVMRR